MNKWHYSAELQTAKQTSTTSKILIEVTYGDFPCHLKAKRDKLASINSTNQIEGFVKFHLLMSWNKGKESFSRAPKIVLHNSAQKSGVVCLSRPWVPIRPTSRVPTCPLSPRPWVLAFQVPRPRPTFSHSLEKPCLKHFLERIYALNTEGDISLTCQPCKFWSAMLCYHMYVIPW